MKNNTKFSKYFFVAVPIVFFLILAVIESLNTMDRKIQEAKFNGEGDKTLVNSSKEEINESQSNLSINKSLQDSKEQSESNLIERQNSDLIVEKFETKNLDSQLDNQFKKGVLNKNTQEQNKNENKATSRFLESELGILDAMTGDIIRKEKDAYGNLLDCSIGNTSESRGLPTCNEIVKERQNVLNSLKEEEIRLQSKIDNEKNNEIFGDNFFVLTNGSKIRVKTSIKFSDKTKFMRDGAEIIINADIENVNATKESFENIFIKSDSRLEISFLDKDNFEILEPVNIPLQIKIGQENNINYRKRVGISSSDLLSIRLQARKPIKSLKEYLSIENIGVSAKLIN